METDLVSMVTGHFAHANGTQKKRKSNGNIPVYLVFSLGGDGVLRVLYRRLSSGDGGF